MKGHIFLTSGQEEGGSSASCPEQELQVPSGLNAVCAALEPSECCVCRPRAI